MFHNEKKINVVAIWKKTEISGDARRNKPKHTNNRSL